MAISSGRSLMLRFQVGRGKFETVYIPLPLVEAARLANKKALDYNSGVKRSNYFPLGLASYAQELHKKSLRLVSLAQSRGATHNESVRDTALDMINYACFLAEALDKGEL